MLVLLVMMASPLSAVTAAASIPPPDSDGSGGTQPNRINAPIPKRNRHHSYKLRQVTYDYKGFIAYFPQSIALISWLHACTKVPKKGVEGNMAQGTKLSDQESPLSPLFPILAG